MPSESEIYAVLTGIFHDVFVRNDLTLSESLSAKDVESWDSYKQIEIIMAVEEHYRIKMSTRELDSLQTVGDLVRVVAAKAD